MALKSKLFNKKTSIKSSKPLNLNKKYVILSQEGYFLSLFFIIFNQGDTMENRNDMKKSKKDYYSAVIICQIVLCILLLLAISFFKTDALKNSYKILMSKNITTKDFTSLVVSVKDYFTDKSSLVSAFSKKQTEEAEVTDGMTELTEETTEAFSGGEDITTAAVPSNCSICVLKLTAPIINPIENGRYTSLFGFRTNPITGEYGFHTGLDIAAKKGARIRAALGGKVTKTGEDSKAGKYIYLAHGDGLVTFYCHCSEIIAQTGAVIRQGETIALVGSTGWSTGPHLHFEVRKNNIRYNPLLILEDDC